MSHHNGHNLRAADPDDNTVVGTSPSPPQSRDSVDEAIDTIFENHESLCSMKDGPLCTRCREAKASIRTLIAGEVVKELERHKDKRCICHEGDINACDALWHHSNNCDSDGHSETA